MAILSNTPGVRYITIQGMVVEDGGVLYPITSFETCDKYIYWNRSTPFKLQSSNKLETTNDLLLTVLNKSGTFTLVNQSEIKISFSDVVNSESVSVGDITGIIEKVDGNTTKIASIVKDVEGINSTVTQVTNDLKTTNEKVSNVEQTANGLVTTVSNLTTEYNDDKAFNLLKENITSTMINQSTLLGELSSIFKEVSKDNNLTEEEKTQVRNKKTEVETENTKLIGYVNQLINSLHEQGMTENEVKLTRAKDNFVTSYNNVSSIIDTTLSATVVVPTQISTIINGISTVVVKLTSLKDVCDDIIFLGTGGVVYEELAKISVTSNSIQQAVSSIKESIKSNLSMEKGKLQSQVDDLNASTGRLGNMIKEIYIDGTVTAAEKVLLNDRITSVEKEIGDLITICDGYLNDTNISVSVNATLLKVKNDFNAIYNTFKTELNTIISDDFFNESEKNSIDVKFKNYVDFIIVFHNNLSLAIDDIEKNRYEKEINDAKKVLQNQISELQKDLNNMDDNINTTFKDNVIDEMERARISQNVLNLNLDKSNIDNQYNQLYKNVLLVDPLKTEFRNAYNLLNTSYNSLLKILNDILAKETLVTNQDKTNIDNGYADLTSKTSPYTITANKVIEFIANAESEQAKNQLQESIDDLNNQLGSIGVNIDGAFADMKLDSIEKTDVNNKLSIIEVNKVKVDTIYNEIYNNTKLTDLTLRDSLKVLYDEFLLKYNNFKTSLNVLMNKQVEVTVEEKNAFNNSIIILSNSIKEFTDLTMTCCEIIGKEVLNELTLNFINAKLGLIDKLVEFTTLMGNSIFDKLLDDVDKSNIINKITELNTVKDIYTELFTSTYINSNLDEVVKNSMTVEKSLFDSKYTLMIESVNAMIEFNGELTDELENNYKSTEHDCKIQHGVLNLTISSADTIILNNIVSTEKDNVIVQTSDICISIRDLDNFMNGVFKDEILDATEKTSLKNNLDIFKSKKLEIDKIHEQTYNNKHLDEVGKLRLKLNYDEYENKYLALVNYIDLLLNTQDKVNEENKLQLIKRINEHNASLSTYVESYNVALDEISQGYSDSTKDTLQNQISNVNNSINDLENTMNGVFQDSVLTEAEKLAIKERLQMLQVEKVNIDKQYETLINNKDLVDISDTEHAKTNLTTAYNNLNTVYASLVDVINTFVNLTGIVDESHRLPVTNAFNDYKSKVGIYSTRVNEAVDAISKKKVNDEAAIREEKIVKLTQDLNGFKLSVSETYSKKAEVDVVKKDLSELTIEVGQISSKVTSTESNLTNLTDRVTSAEEKITTDAIINTVSSATTSDGNKKFAESSEVTQKINEVEMKFTQSGGYNRLKNSLPNVKGVDGWSQTTYDIVGNNLTRYFQIRNNEWTGYEPALEMNIADMTSGEWRISQDVNTVVGQQYILTGYIAGHRSEKVIYIRSQADSEWEITKSVEYDRDISGGGNGDDYSNWVKIQIPFTANRNITKVEFLIRSGKNAFLWLKKLMLTEGSVVKPWSPNPNEIYDGITRIDKDGVTVSMQDGEGNQGSTNLGYDGLTIYHSNGTKKAWFGDGDSAFIDKISTNKIIEPTLIKWAKDRPLNLYVSPNATGDGTGRNEQNMSSSVNNALEYVRREFGCYTYRSNLNVWIQPGVYNYNMYIGGWLGSGCLTINFSEQVYHRGGVIIEDNTTTIKLLAQKNPWDWNTQNYVCLIATTEENISIRNSTVLIAGLNMQKEYWGGQIGTWTNYEKSAIVANCGSRVYVACCDIVGFYNCYVAYDGAIINTYANRGHAQLLCSVFGGGQVSIDSYQPIWNQQEWTRNGGLFFKQRYVEQHNSWFDSKPDAPQPPPPPPPTENWCWTENTWWASSLWTAPEGSGVTTSGKSGNTGQGYWGSYKAHRGYMSFDGINGWCHGGRNFTAYITLHRVNTNHGIAGATPVPKFVDINGSSWSCGVGFARNDTKTIQLPWDVAKILIEGHSNTIQMWAGKSTNDYSFYDNVSIRVVCEKNFI